MAFDRKAYLAAYNKSHYQNNKEKRKQQATEWYYANQEKAINNVLTYYKLIKTHGNIYSRSTVRIRISRRKFL